LKILCVIVILALSETVEEPTHIISIRKARGVGAPATLDSFAPTVGMKKDRKKVWID
jgi:hypothetical protein